SRIHATGSPPIPVQIPFSRPICGVPAGRQAYMNCQIVPAPTKLMAIGRKMVDLAIFSEAGLSRSARTATASPITTVAAGTIMIHCRVFHNACLEAPSAGAWEESIGGRVELQREGEIRWIGSSNADSALIQRAVRLCGVVAGQNELSPAALGGRSELELCERWGITYLPWRPLAAVT